MQTCLIGMDLLSQASFAGMRGLSNWIQHFVIAVAAMKNKKLSNWIVTNQIILHFSTEVQLSIHYQSQVTPGSTIWKSILLLDISTEAKTFPIQYFQSASAVLPSYRLPITCISFLPLWWYTSSMESYPSSWLRTAQSQRYMAAMFSFFWSLCGDIFT